MTILSAQSIRALGVGLFPIVEPFRERTEVDGLTYGLGPAGYDVRIDQNVSLKPGWTKLASTVEQFHIPNDIMAFVHDKSTWAREFLTVQNTVIEPGWHGFLTLELINHSATIIDIRAGSPIAQIVFHKLDAPTDTPYRGKYQDQARRPVAPIRAAPVDFHTTGTVAPERVKGVIRLTPGDEGETNIFIDNKRVGWWIENGLFLFNDAGVAEKITDCYRDEISMIVTREKLK